ncbi:hypothetical protein CPB84DRAFT_1851574 [Gymnopilus junonius]|uniref:Uncharacterized protein n=1 Tax=Gymnopilus junonius TaxID=109634 RepID=A0A9P5NFB2_GYMJU|nr:hypothetical protein CPB84DRAFT_1851574 [Gymnopilus junonius]
MSLVIIPSTVRQSAVKPMSVKVIESSKKFKASSPVLDFHIVEDSDGEVVSDNELPPTDDMDAEEIGESGDDVDMDEEESADDVGSDVNTSLDGFIVDDDATLDESEQERASEPEDLVALGQGDSLYPDPPVPDRLRGSKRKKKAHVITSPPATPTADKDLPVHMDASLMKMGAGSAKCIFKDSSLKSTAGSKAIKLLDALENEMKDDIVTASEEPVKEDVNLFVEVLKQPKAAIGVKPKKRAVASMRAKVKKELKEDVSEEQKEDASEDKKSKEKKKFNLSSLSKKTDSAPTSTATKQESANSAQGWSDIPCLRVKALPASCGFAESLDKSELMKANGLYDNLPNLQYVSRSFGSSYFEACLQMLTIIIPPKETRAYGLPTIDAVYESGVIRNFDVEHALTAMTFEQSGRYVNIARFNPMGLVAKQTWRPDRYEVCVNFQDMAFCITPMMVTNSHIHQHHNIGKFPSYQVQGRMFAEEFGRFCSALGMLVHEDEIFVHTFKDAISFSSKMGTEGATLEPDVRLDDTPVYLSTGSSPAKKPSNQDKSKSKRFKDIPASGHVPLLEWDDEIPAYDCRRDHNIEFNENTFDNLASKYELYDREIPNDCFVVVGHLVYIQKAGRYYKVFTYAHWFMVLDGPDAPKDSIIDAVIEQASC